MQGVSERWSVGSVATWNVLNIHPVKEVAMVVPPTPARLLLRRFRAARSKERRKSSTNTFTPMRALLALNPYFRRYRGRLFLGVLFVALSSLFSVVAPQVVRGAFDLIAAGIEQRDLPVDQRHIAVPDQLQSWLGWTGLDLQGWLSGPLDDASINSKVMAFAALYAGIFIAFTLLQGFFMFLMRQTIIVMSRLVEYDLKNDVFLHYERLDRAFYKRNSTGDLMNRISEDVGKVRMYVGPAVMYILQMIVTTVMTVWVMVQVNGELTLYALAPLPLLSVIIYYVSDIINKRSLEVQKQQSRLSTLAQESFSGVRVLKAYAKEGMAAERFKRAANDYRKSSLAQAKVDALFMPAMMLLIGLSTVLVIFIGGLMLMRGDSAVTVGNLAEFTLYVQKLTWPFASLGWITSQVQQAAASMARVNEFLDTQPEVKNEGDALSEVKGAITFDNVGFTYPDTGIRALDHVSFHVPAGSTLAIVGHTGSGKSTIADLIGRQFDATSGEVRIDGVPIRSIALEKLRSQLGFVPQDVFLFSDSIRNNIAFSLDKQVAVDSAQWKVHSGRSAVGNGSGQFTSEPASASASIDRQGASPARHSSAPSAVPIQARVEQAARIAQVHDNITGFPQGYDTLLGERGVTLSGGQKQRVSIARAIIRQPRILVFDDPLSAVDTATEEAILRDLKQVMAGRTTVIISHRISAVKDADHILVLEQGRVVEEGRHTELITRGGHYGLLHEEQLLEEARPELG
jgi:ATP-binding cassette subfamily B protein